MDRAETCVDRFSGSDIHIKRILAYISTCNGYSVDIFTALETDLIKRISVNVERECSMVVIGVFHNS